MKILIFSVFGDSSSAFWAMMSFFAIAVSFIFIFKQIKIQNNANMMSFINSSEEKWRSREFVEIRKNVCSTSGTKIGINEECLLSFFEDLGLLYKKGVIDLEIIWEKFSYYIENYWVLLEQNIKEIQSEKNDSTWFENFECLQKEVFNYSKKKTNNQFYTISTSDSIKFKESESNQHCV